MSTNTKPEPTTSDFEVESHDLSLHPKLKTLSLLDGARVALTAVGFLAGITVLGVSADAVAVYEATHLPPEYNLPLWPKNFNIGPTIALVVCSVLIILANGASLALCRGKSAQAKASYPLAALVAPPAVSLIAALVAISFFYGVNASESVDTLLSWSCQWRNVAMNTRPHFGTLCRQSRAAVYLSIVLVPLQVVVLGMAGWQVGAGRVVRGIIGNKASPPPSRGL